MINSEFIELPLDIISPITSMCNIIIDSSLNDESIKSDAYLILNILENHTIDIESLRLLLHKYYELANMELESSFNDDSIKEEIFKDLNYIITIFNDMIYD